MVQHVLPSMWRLKRKWNLLQLYWLQTIKVITVEFYLLNCFLICEQQDTRLPSSLIFPDHSDLDQDQALKKIAINENNKIHYL